MNRFFRSSTPGLGDYARLALFGLIYLAAVGLVLFPERFIAVEDGAAGFYFSD